MLQFVINIDCTSTCIVFPVRQSVPYHTSQHLCHRTRSYEGPISSFAFCATQLQLRIGTLFFQGSHARNFLVPFIGPRPWYKCYPYFALQLARASATTGTGHYHHSPSKKLRSCAVSPPVPLTGGGGVAFSTGKLALPLPTRNASGVDSGE